ncbi:MAG: ATP-binding protein [Bacteroidales bacterium]|nr:ATP-binding protein [Bacteroidales bacterium]
MEKSFVFGKPVDSDNFIGREVEVARLSANFRGGINTILMSPRRWGKTSLVNRVANEIASPNLKIVRMDIFSCRSEYDFYNMFAAEILKQTASRLEEWKELAVGFIERLTPKISITPDAATEYSVSLGITPKTHSPEEILNLPEVIAQRKGYQMVVCIDEFQQIGEFPASLSVQKRMRSVWQHQQNASYCLYGSKLHLMTNFFQKKSYPFYKFGDFLYLENIPTDKWIPYVQQQFQTVGKNISPELVSKLCATVDNHSSYVQQLAWYTLLNTQTTATEDNLSAAVEELVQQNEPLFVQQTETLTSYQLNFLRAVLRGVKSGFGATNIREEYQLGTTSNIVRLKQALLEKELIEIHLNGVSIADPVLNMWLRKVLY